MEGLDTHNLNLMLFTLRSRSSHQSLSRRRDLASSHNKETYAHFPPCFFLAESQQSNPVLPGTLHVSLSFLLPCLFCTLSPQYSPRGQARALFYIHPLSSSLLRYYFAKTCWRTTAAPTGVTASRLAFTLSSYVEKSDCPAE